MCDDRERLIGYVYDECDANERRAVESHLHECPECRQEIAGLRQARQDLLAWRVPDHEPIWRPVPAVPVRAWWQQVPTWAMTAAASGLLMVGALGGAATRLFFMPNVPAVTVAAEPARVSPADLAAIEARLLARLRAEMETRRAVVSIEPRESAARTADPSVATLAREVSELRAQQILLAENLMDDVRNISERQRTTDERSYMLLTSIAEAGRPSAGGGR